MLTFQDDPFSGEILVRTRMRASATLRHREGRGHHESSDLSASPGSGAMECGLRGAFPRPTDGRYGETPNRLQHYYQYQVILKPSPLDIQDIYIESLAAFGIDPLAHDIRFVEDDSESPTLGAWGVGWKIGSTVWKSPSLLTFNRPVDWI